jgi:predicted ATPase
MIKAITIKHFKGLANIHLENLDGTNMFLGKNNSGKSSILHAIHISCLAIDIGHWNTFQPKLALKDLIADVGNFEIALTYNDGTVTTVKTNDNFAPTFDNRNETHKPKSISIIPDVGLSLLRRNAKSPSDAYRQLLDGDFTQINANEILYALKFYSAENQKGLTAKMYTDLIDDLKKFFPDISEFISALDEHNIPSLYYTEQETKRDLLYSGTGLKHILDVIVKITLSNAKVVCLDEPELGLHPDIQRKFFEYIDRISKERNIQFFIGTHSQIILSFSDLFNFHRVLNVNGVRSVLRVNRSAIHTTLSDLGLRPSDVFNQDICLMVEGATDVVFFEYIIRVLYKTEFAKIGMGIIQYGGGAASGIANKTIDVGNIVSSQKYILWTHDRDARPVDNPSTDAVKFKNAIERANMKCHIWAKREIEYYFPRILHDRTQQGSIQRILATRLILMGDQSQKYDVAAAAVTPDSVYVPTPKLLKRLLPRHVANKTDIDQEIRDLIETVLIPWKDEILGTSTNQPLT